MDVILAVIGVHLWPVVASSLGTSYQTLVITEFLEPEDVVLMAEVWSEASYVKHHKQKIALVFSAMRHFADTLVASGRQVIYVKLDDPENTQSLDSEVQRVQERFQFDGWCVTEPGEWRLKQQFEALQEQMAVPFEIIADDRFLCSHDAFEAFLAGRKQPEWSIFTVRFVSRLVFDGR